MLPLFLIHLIFIGGAFRYFLRLPFTILHLRVFSMALGCKLIAAIALGLLYTAYYSGGDTFNYFHDAVRISNTIMENPQSFFSILSGKESVAGLVLEGQERAIFFSKFISLLSLCSFNNYWLIDCYLAVYALLCNWYLIMVLDELFHKAILQIFISFLFIPSVIFWSSGLLKETVALSVIYLATGLELRLYFQKLSTKFIVIHLLIMLFSLWMLWQIKYYYAAVIIPVFFSLLFFKNFKVFSRTYFKSAYVSYILVLSLLFMAVYISMQLHPNLNPSNIFQAIVKNHDLSVAASDAGDFIEYGQLEPTLVSFISNVPKAIFSGLFRPFIGEGHTFLQILMGIENLFIVLISLLAFTSVFFLKKIQNPELILACLGYIIVLAALLSLASPNFGSLVRYRVAYIPFNLFLCLLLIRENPLFIQ